ncbi:glycosyltransferase family 4 protein [Gallibacterium melopsittaci]|uniref:Glycosyltransferase family 4 protein n=1 Tax=Gallibacterium melopsittaci TaxID=516063 RepID=A0ABV6HSY7_9PAST
MIIFDTRWVGNNGIGRFSKEVYDRLYLEKCNLSGSPVSPLDPFKLSLIYKNMDRKTLFLSPGYNGPLFSDISYILTIHDINHIDRKENSNIFKRIYYRTVLFKLVSNAKLIFTVSEFSKERILDYFHIDKNKVIVVGNGVSEEFSTIGNKFDIGNPYILCVSNRKKHKNEEGLLDAFSRSNIPKYVKLIFTGKETEELKELIAELNLDNRVIFIGKVSNAQLSDLYRGAVFTIFPSFYEGFGLPIVESFACGTPVITSNVTSMPEIAKDGAILINPNNIEEIINSIDLLFNDTDLQKSLSQRGIEIAKEYTWENTVNKIRNAILDLGYNLELRDKA